MSNRNGSSPATMMMVIKRKLIKNYISYMEPCSIIDAFLFRPGKESIEEFKPTSRSLEDAIGLLRESDLQIQCALFLHLHYQVCTICKVPEDELQHFGRSLGVLFSSLQILKYANYYGFECKELGECLIHGLQTFNELFILQSAFDCIFHFQEFELPDHQKLVSGLDEDAKRWLNVHVLTKMDCIFLILKHLQSGDKLEPSRALKDLIMELQPEYAILVMKLLPEQTIKNPNQPKTPKKALNSERIAKGYLNPHWDWQGNIDPAVRYAYEYLRLDKPVDLPDGVPYFKGSLELSCFHSQFMNKLYGKLFGLAPILMGTFPDILPEKLNVPLVDPVVKVNGIVQVPNEPVSLMTKQWINLFSSLNEALRLLNYTNRRNVDAVWIFRNKPEKHVDSTYAGLLLALGLHGLLQELPLLALMDVMREGEELVQSALLLAIGFSYSNSERFDEGVEGLISMHIRSHYVNHNQRIFVSGMVQTSAILAFGFLYHDTADRQSLHTLFTELSRSGQDQTENGKTTRQLQPSFYLACGISIGLIGSGGLREALEPSQLDYLLSAANGHLSEQNVHLQSAAYLALMIGGLGSGDVALCNCLLKVNGHNPVNIFLNHLAILLIEWKDCKIEKVDGEFSYYTLASQFLYAAIRGDLSMVDVIKERLEELKQKIIEDENIIRARKESMAIDFCMDVGMMALAVLLNGTCDGHVMRLLRDDFKSNLDFKFGRSAYHSLALGFLCQQKSRLALNGNRFELTCILLSALPFWSDSILDSLFYPNILRYAYVMACKDTEVFDLEYKTVERSKLLQDFAIFSAFRPDSNTMSVFSEKELAKIF